MSSTVLTNSNNLADKEKNIVRDSNIELLRILTICGVVMLHYNGLGAFAAVRPNSFNYYVLLALEGLCICAVNLFVLISGYFLSTNNKRRIIKAIELIVQVMVINLALNVVSTVLSGYSISIKSMIVAMVPNNYFVAFYVTLYLISPYINVLLKRLSDKQFGILLGLSLLLFAFWPTFVDSVSAVLGVSYSGIYTTNTGGSQQGYSIINFALMYLVGAYLKRKDFKFSKLKCFVILLLLIAVLILWQTWQPQIARAYCNPLVIACAVVIFLIFKNITVKSNIINCLAKGAFTCFLIHGVLLSYIKIESFVNRNVLILLGHILVSIPMIFLVCWVCWWVYDKISAPVFKFIGKKLSFIDKMISIEE